MAYNEFLAWVGGTVSGDNDHPKLLPKSKYERFKQLLTLPVETVELTEAAYSKLNRVFDAEDAMRYVEFEKDETAEEFNSFYDPLKYWSTVGAETIKTSINAVWVADLPKEQTGDYPEPYGYIVDISSVEDIMNDNDNNCQWVLFCVTGEEYEPGRNKYLMVYDNEAIRKYRFHDGQIVSDTPEAEFMHGLDYTPARQVWSDRLEKNDPVNKKSPITNVLNALDNYLFMSVNKKYMDLGNSYPITATYERRGDEPQDNKQDSESDTIKKPAGSDILGPGTFVELPAPLPGEIDMMANPVQIIAPDVSSLEYHSKMLENKKDEIFISVVGREDDRTNDQAKNEMQVQSAVESREEVLMRYKRNWEIIEKFTTRTIAQLRHNEVKSVVVDYGSEFFLKSFDNLLEDYQKAKASGADPVILEDINDSILSYKYRNNPAGRQRANIISDLTPYKDKSIEELIDLNEKGIVRREDLILRVNVLDLIRRFEMEVKPLSSYVADKDYKKAIKTIKETLMSYISELNVELN